MWRGGSGLAEKVASGLQKVPMVVSAGLLCAVPLSCGAASLVAGAAFYAFMVSLIGQCKIDFNSVVSMDAFQVRYIRPCYISIQLKM